MDRTDCSKHMQKLEQEMCNLKKIRNELYRIKAEDSEAFFQDCEVSGWQAERCSQGCAGGTQRLTRSIISHPVGGMKCPPLIAFRRCNEQPCPINCEVSEWSGWSACSARCGGGVRERLRTVRAQAKYDGLPCGQTSQTAACSMQACEADCTLRDWSDWAPCSKACSGGSQSRRRVLLEAADGRGSCPAEEGPERLERRSCNKDDCRKKNYKEPLKCLSKVDVILLLDGSSNLGPAGWAATKAFAQAFLGSFAGEGSDAQVAVVLFSGPSGLGRYTNCMDGRRLGGSLADCGVRMVQHLNNDTAKIAASVGQLQWPQGTALTSVALKYAEDEAALSRREAPVVVLVVTGAAPLSARMTAEAAKSLRRVARLMFLPVRLRPGAFRAWSSRPPEENVVRVAGFEDLSSVDTIDRIVADMCPSLDILSWNETALAA